ncbi:hypothetical protein OSB04_022128 [Centaurea solstitialis]|uniref:DUF4218 domain-containing protein n=1 Tax=Centaurea solstitialis TaxID=347529 RepID=A0AA38SVI8_9ASTR|nr:hypothetical protein OSB04_022128 [Centaurea solstitialis]
MIILFILIPSEIPPGFFDSMEHLVVHLAREALVGGPVQYRWMYLYERRLGSLKRTVRNKAKVEGSIVEAYLVNELSTYCSLYFEPTVETRLNRESRNFTPQCESSDQRLSVFKTSCRSLYDKAGRHCQLEDEDMHKAHTYILLNCEEVSPFTCMFTEMVRCNEPYIDEAGLDRRRNEQFADWFESYVMSSTDPTTDRLKVLASRPLRFVCRHPGFFVNGYKFHTQTHGTGRTTHNSGVCVRGSCYSEYESDYYGLLDEVLEIEYHGYGLGRCVVPLFRCTWFDTVNGVRVDPKHNLVDIKPKSRLRSDDPFILASQAEQVYYVPYPSKSLKDWWSVVKTKPRGVYELASEVPSDENVGDEQFFQENDIITAVGRNEDVDEPICLVTEEEDMEIADDHHDNWHVDESSDEEEEFQESNGDSEDEELDLLDHSSDD